MVVHEGAIAHVPLVVVRGAALKEEEWNDRRNDRKNDGRLAERRTCDRSLRYLHCTRQSSTHPTAEDVVLCWLANVVMLVAVGVGRGGRGGAGSCDN
mmetsp:Transcript_3395/g.9651  ORF Transcript_3395/g.9651 Transcript_3395/m.9651 type:complete len:97 (-) Transcript_3395:137-427(-)